MVLDTERPFVGASPPSIVADVGQEPAAMEFGILYEMGTPRPNA
jgi:hypothetical protein